MTKRRTDTKALFIWLWMREKDLDELTWGDGDLTGAGNYVEIRGHPLDVMRKTLDEMEKRPDLFMKRKIRAHDSLGRSRVVRSFLRLDKDRPVH